ncbi:hypothetical protein SAMN06265370_1335 [Puniceibacterium sediminis]|uniref:Uncharacterized protein n=1 Tax=Puniceibacterium sediminis TaxID=1608407 RepID=A0A238ZL72_9RHOB|nr:hypothetical protein SAMN06265370_1335 [Puniceibacterium sediminis]
MGRDRTPCSNRRRLDTLPFGVGRMDTSRYGFFIACRPVSHAIFLSYGSVQGASLLLQSLPRLRR